MKTICKECIYFENIGKEYGYCHKLPPLAQGSITNLATFPKVKHDWYCFDGQPIAKIIEEPQMVVEETTTETDDVSIKRSKKSKDIEGQ